MFWNYTCLKKINFWYSRQGRTEWPCREDIRYLHSYVNCSKLSRGIDRICRYISRISEFSFCFRSCFRHHLFDRIFTSSMGIWPLLSRKTEMESKITLYLIGHGNYWFAGDPAVLYSVSFACRPASFKDAQVIPPYATFQNKSLYKKHVESINGIENEIKWVSFINYCDFNTYDY